MRARSAVLYASGYPVLRERWRPEHADLRLLVTALNVDIGRWNWWPSLLARKLAAEAETAGERAAVAR